MISVRPQHDHRSASPQDAALLPDNPGLDFLSSEEWASVAAKLQLTPRELSVATLLFEGKSRFQVSRRLGCAPGTVRVYIDRLFAKLQVSDRVGVVLRVVRIHWALTQQKQQPFAQRQVGDTPSTGPLARE
jgi:DNA-binding NarL/FixJ family response regulator